MPAERDGRAQPAAVDDEEVLEEDVDDEEPPEEVLDEEVLDDDVEDELEPEDELAAGTFSAPLLAEVDDVPPDPRESVR